MAGLSIRSHGAIMKGAECVGGGAFRQRGIAKDIRAYCGLLELICIEGLICVKISTLHGWSGHKQKNARRLVRLRPFCSMMWPRGLALGRGR